MERTADQGQVVAHPRLAGAAQEAGSGHHPHIGVGYDISEAYSALVTVSIVEIHCHKWAMGYPGPHVLIF